MKYLVLLFSICSIQVEASRCPDPFENNSAIYQPLVYTETKESLLGANHKTLQWLARTAGYELKRELSVPGIISELQTRLLELYDEYDPNVAPFAPWALQMLKYKIIDLKRHYFDTQSNQYHHNDIEKVDEARLATQPIVNDKKWQYLEVLAAFKKLSWLEKNVLKLVVIDSMNLDDVAHIFEISSKSVVRIRFLAQERMRLHLNKYWDKDEMTVVFGRDFVSQPQEKPFDIPKSQKPLMYIYSLDRNIVIDCMEELSDQEKGILIMLLDGKTGISISKEQGLSESSISHFKNKAIKKILKSLLEKGLGDRETIEGFLKK